MSPRIVIKTIRNFFCGRINAEVHLEYCTDFHYQPGRDLIVKELTLHPDCEQKDHCGIACRKEGKVVYDWSGCLHPELQNASVAQEKNLEMGLMSAGMMPPVLKKES